MSKILIKIQKGGRITLPPEIVQAFKLKVGDVLEVKAVDDMIILIPVKLKNKALSSIHRSARKTGLDKMSNEKIEEEIRKHRQSKLKK